MMSWKWYVYIIECEDGTYYTGLTWKPDLRWTQHLSGFGAKYTAKHKPKKLVYMEEHEDLYVARLREKQIKDWRQEKKRKLINGEWARDWNKPRNIDFVESVERRYTNHYFSSEAKPNREAPRRFSTPPAKNAGSARTITR